MCSELAVKMLDVVYRRTREGQTNFDPNTRAAVRETYESLKKGEIRAAIKAAKKTELSNQIYQEAKKSTSIKKMEKNNGPVQSNNQ